MDPSRFHEFVTPTRALNYSGAPSSSGRPTPPQHSDPSVSRLPLNSSGSGTSLLQPRFTAPPGAMKQQAAEAPIFEEFTALPPRRFASHETEYHTPMLGTPDYIVDYREKQEKDSERSKVEYEAQQKAIAKAMEESNSSAGSHGQRVMDGQNRTVIQIPPPPRTPGKDLMSPPPRRGDALGKAVPVPHGERIAPDPHRLYIPIHPAAQEELDDETYRLQRQQQLARARMNLAKTKFGGANMRNPKHVPFAVRPYGHDEIYYTGPTQGDSPDVVAIDVTHAEVVEAEVQLPMRHRDYTKEHLVKRKIVCYDDDEGFTFHARPLLNLTDGLRHLQGLPPLPPDNRSGHTPPAEPMPTLQSHLDEAERLNRSPSPTAPDGSGGSSPRAPPTPTADDDFGLPPPVAAAAAGKHVTQAELQQQLRPNDREIADYEARTYLFNELKTSMADGSPDLLSIGNRVLVVSPDRTRALQFDPGVTNRTTGLIAGDWMAVDFTGDAPPEGCVLTVVESKCIILAVDDNFLYSLDLSSFIKRRRVAIGVEVDVLRPTFRWTKSAEIYGYTPMVVGWAHVVHFDTALYVKDTTSRQHAIISCFSGLGKSSRPVSLEAPVAKMLRGTPTNEPMTPVRGVPGVAISVGNDFCWVYVFIPLARNWLPIHRLDDIASPAPLYCSARKGIYLFGQDTTKKNANVLRVLYKVKVPDHPIAESTGSPSPTKGSPNGHMVSQVTEFKSVDEAAEAYAVTSVKKQKTVIVGTPVADLALLCPMYGGAFAIVSCDLESYVISEVDRWEKVREFMGYDEVREGSIDPYEKAVVIAQD